MKDREAWHAEIHGGVGWGGDGHKELDTTERLNKLEKENRESSVFILVTEAFHYHRAPFKFSPSLATSRKFSSSFKFLKKVAGLEMNFPSFRIIYIFVFY